MAHRQLATPAALGVGLLALTGVALPSGSSHLQGLAWGAAALVVVQVVLGVSTLRLELQQPLVTVAHQICAALLLAVAAGGALAGNPRTELQRLLDDAIASSGASGGELHRAEAITPELMQPSADPCTLHLPLRSRDGGLQGVLELMYTEQTTISMVKQ